MTYEQATAVTELPEVGVAEVALLSRAEIFEGIRPGETTEEIFVTDEGNVGEAPADVTIH